MIRATARALTAVLPWPLRRRLLIAVFGYEIDPSAPELPPASPGGYSPPSQYLGSIPTMFDIDPLTGALAVKPSWGQYYVPTPGTATLGALGLLVVARRRSR
jgi:hypothetical protein